MSKQRSFVATACIVSVMFNITVLYAQEKTDPVGPSQEKKIPDSSIPDMPEHLKNDSLPVTSPSSDTVGVEILTDSLSGKNGAGQFAAIEHTIELPKKDFHGSAMDITLGAITIGSWLVFMWLAANQKD